MAEQLTKLVYDLEQADKKVQREVRKAVKQSGAKVAKQAERRAPKDTGELRRSIYYEITREGFKAVVKAEKRYAMPVEYGTVKMAPRPFMRPALEAVEPEFVEAMQKAVEGMFDGPAAGSD